MRQERWARVEGVGGIRCSVDREREHFCCFQQLCVSAHLPWGSVMALYAVWHAYVTEGGILMVVHSGQHKSGDRSKLSVPSTHTHTHAHTHTHTNPHAYTQLAPRTESCFSCVCSCISEMTTQGTRFALCLLNCPWEGLCIMSALTRAHPPMSSSSQQSTDLWPPQLQNEERICVSPKRGWSLVVAWDVSSEICFGWRQQMLCVSEGNKQVLF